MLKKLFFILCSTISACVYADSGLYLGIGTGYATINAKTTNGFSYIDGNSDKSDGNMLGNLFIGYDFSRYVGLQADYYYIASTQYSTGSDIPGIQGSFTINQQTIALGITGHLPFELFANSLSGLSLFAKLGIGYNTINIDGGTVANPDQSYIQSLSGYSGGLSPMIGGGVEYGIDNVGLRAEYERIGDITFSRDNQNLLNINNNLYMVSAFYHF
jgi:hypothetical protein